LKKIKLKYQELLGHFLDENDDPIDEIVVLVGEHVSFVCDDVDIFASINHVDSDFKIISDGGLSYDLPFYSTFQNRECAADDGVWGNESTIPIFTLTHGKIEEIEHLRMTSIEPVPGGHDLNHPRVVVTVDGKRLIEGEDFSLIFGSIDGSGNETQAIQFKKGRQPVEGAMIRIKWQQYVNTDLSNGFVIDQRHRWRAITIATDDYLTKLRVNIKESRTYKREVTIPKRAPAYIKQNYPVFVKFLETYFKFMDYESTVSELMAIRDIDDTTAEIIDKIGIAKLASIPKKTAVDQRLLIKNIIPYFDSRGTEQSFSFIMQALFKRRCQIIQPKDNILRASSAKWNQEKTIRVISMKQAFGLAPQENINDALDFFGPEIYSSASQFGDADLLVLLSATKIMGVRSRAEAVVESVRQYVINGETITELSLSNIVGEFDPYEVITPLRGVDLSKIEDKSKRSLHFVHAMTVPQVVDLEFVRTIDTSIQPKHNDHFAISSVTGHGANVVYQFEKPVVFDPGFNYQNGDQAFLQTLNENNVLINVSEYKVKTGVHFKWPGSWTQNRSLLSDISLSAHDSWFYQLFSYVIATDIPETEFRNMIESINHIAGTQMFARFLGGSDFKVSPSIKSASFVVNSSKSFFFVSDELIDKDDLKIFSDDRLIGPDEYEIVHSNGKSFVSINENTEIDEHYITIIFKSESFKYDYQNTVKIWNETKDVWESYTVDAGGVLDPNEIGTAFFDKLLTPVMTRYAREDAAWTEANNDQENVFASLPLITSGTYYRSWVDFEDDYLLRYNINNDLSFTTFYNEMRSEPASIKRFLNHRIKTLEDRRPQRDVSNWSSDLIRVVAFDKDQGRFIYNKIGMKVIKNHVEIGSVVEAIDGTNFIWAIISFKTRADADGYIISDQLYYKMENMRD
jgi:hypothetical protein